MDFLKDIKNNDGQTSLYFIGQAGFIIKSKKGHLLGIDLYLSDCVERVETDHVGFKRLLPKIINPNDIIFDVLICTHFHRDHYDVDSIPFLMKNDVTHLFCPEDCKEDSENLNRVTIVKPGQNYKINDFNIHFINCDHGSGAPFAVGVIIEVDGIRILEVGDTCLRTDRIDEYLSFGKIDTLIAPINGMYGNLNSSECAELVNLIQPKFVIPCHYGMFAAHHGDVGLFHEIMDREYPNNKYLIMRQGEKYIFTEND